MEEQFDGLYSFSKPLMVDIFWVDILYQTQVEIKLKTQLDPLGAGVRWAAFLGDVGLGETVLILGPDSAGWPR